MKRLLLCTLFFLTFCNLILAQSSLPECKGNDKNVSEFSGKHLRGVKKWTNCHGTTIGPKGEKYVGEFYKGKFHGQGTFTQHGRKYVGQYKNHKRDGQGTYTYANGDKYVGEWKKHKYFGYGIYTYANGDTYIGEWKKDAYNAPDNLKERQGQGTLTKTDGTIENGIWKKGKLIKPKQ